MNIKKIVGLSLGAFIALIVIINVASGGGSKDKSAVTSFEIIARYVEALGGRLDLVADFGDRTVRLPVSDTAHAA